MTYKNNEYLHNNSRSYLENLRVSCIAKYFNVCFERWWSFKRENTKGRNKVSDDIYLGTDQYIRIKNTANMLSLISLPDISKCRSVILMLGETRQSFPCNIENETETIIPFITELYIKCGHMRLSS